MHLRNFKSLYIKYNPNQTSQLSVVVKQKFVNLNCLNNSSPLRIVTFVNLIIVETLGCLTILISIIHLVLFDNSRMGRFWYMF